MKMKTIKFIKSSLFKIPIRDNQAEYSNFLLWNYFKAQMFFEKSLIRI